MVPAPIIDSSWHRLPTDSFGAGPSTSTPIDPSSTVPHDSDAESDSSSWSFSDTEELITLDLGTERIAKRALLGYSGGLDYIDAAPSAAAASSSTRSVRSTRGTTNTSAEASTNTAQASTNSTHLGAGKHLSITGLDTSTPLMKINDTVLRGSLMQMFGTEIVLKDEFDPTRDKGKQHRLQPISPGDGRANVDSSTTRKRILFRPLYDPKSRETVGNEDAYTRLQALATGGTLVNVTEASGRSTLEALTTDPTVGEAEPGLGRGKYKRKEVSEEEQMIRAAERKVRKAAKEHLEQQQQLQQQQASATAAATPEAPAQDEPLQTAEHNGSQLEERPSSSIEPNNT
ncbi:TFIIIC_sub6 domain-containing protein [Pseudozyma hubeiensis]|nr:TFIIIC_sub6 domain-containing protein [Pseudozyma hubeiensis]